MYINKDIYQKIILYIGNVESYKSYFPISEVKISPYTDKEIYDHISLMIEGEIIQGIFVDDISSNHYGYLIGGITTETRYLYNKIRKYKKIIDLLIYDFL